MRCRLPQRLAYAFAVSAMALYIAAQAPADAQQIFAGQDIHKLVQDLRDGTLELSYASDQCRRDVMDDPDEQDIRQLMATFLDVPEDLSIQAFCTALVQALRDNELSEQTLLAVNHQIKDAGAFMEVGRLLRAVYFSHRLNTTASAAKDNLK